MCAKYSLSSQVEIIKAEDSDGASGSPDFGNAKCPRFWERQPGRS